MAVLQLHGTPEWTAPAGADPGRGTRRHRRPNFQTSGYSTFDGTDARAAGLLRAVTEPIRRALPPPRRTLSHGDHACLALAARLELPAVTADWDWPLYAEAAGVEVRTIR